jgi:hypothetical protein
VLFSDTYCSNHVVTKRQKPDSDTHSCLWKRQQPLHTSKSNHLPKLRNMALRSHPTATTKTGSRFTGNDKSLSSYLNSNINQTQRSANSPKILKLTWSSTGGLELKIHCRNWIYISDADRGLSLLSHSRDSKCKHWSTPCTNFWIPKLNPLTCICLKTAITHLRQSSQLKPNKIRLRLINLRKRHYSMSFACQVKRQKL